MELANLVGTDPDKCLSPHVDIIIVRFIHFV